MAFRLSALDWVVLAAVVISAVVLWQMRADGRGSDGPEPGHNID